jgi:hypothetical protein
LFARRSENLWNLPAKTVQLYGMLFCRAANFFLNCEQGLPRNKNFDTYQQKQLTSTVFCSTAQRKVSEFANKNN